MSVDTALRSASREGVRDVMRFAGLHRTHDLRYTEGTYYDFRIDSSPRTRSRFDFRDA